MNNRVLIWINIILFLGLLLIVFELQGIKKDFFNDPVMQYLGEEKEDIIKQYGEPDFRGEIGGPGGEMLFYEREKISFIFAGEDNIVNNLELYPEREVLGVTIGMTFDEITEIMGTPIDRGYDPYDGDYTIIYYLGEEKDGMGEVEIWFSADNDDAPTNKAQIFWKNFWR